MKLRLFALFCALSMLCCRNMYADDSYPQSFSVYTLHEGGKIIIANRDNSAPKLYFIKSNIFEDNQTLYTWYGYERRDVRGDVVGEGTIINAKAINGLLCVVIKQGQEFFAGFIDQRNSMKELIKLDIPQPVFDNLDINWIGTIDEATFLLRFNNKLFSISLKNEIPEINVVANNVIRALIWSDSTNAESKLITIEGASENGFVTIYGSDLSLQKSLRIQLYEIIDIRRSGNLLAVVNATKSQSLINLVDIERGVFIDNFWVEAPPSQISFSQYGTFFYSLNYKSGRYNIVKNSIVNYKNGMSSYIELPPELVEPIGFKLFGDKIVAIFKNGIVTMDTRGETLTAFDLLPIGRWFENTPEMTYRDGKLILSDFSGSVIINERDNKFWFVTLYINTFGKFIVPIILIILGLILLQFYRHQKRLLNTLFDLPSSGFIYVLDNNGKLTRCNDLGKKMLQINDNTPLRRQFAFYFADDKTKPILELAETALTEKGTLRQRIALSDDEGPKEWLCTLVAIRNIAGAFRGIVFTGIDITEQLERKRLTNWAQLAHDMQTNLSTIKLNAEHLEVADNENNRSRRTKITHQVNILLQRIRDIVTVGRNDTLDVSMVSAAEICEELRNEFDDTVFPNVSFVVDTDGMSVICDKPKIIRAMRNAVENGIKSLKGAPGSIIISCRKDAKYYYFSVRDTGCGMDDDIKKKFLLPFFTTAKKSGGSGIGTMIMQYVAELHEGKLTVISEEGSGTEIIFNIPIAEMSKKLAENK